MLLAMSTHFDFMSSTVHFADPKRQTVFYLEKWNF